MKVPTAAAILLLAIFSRTAMAELPYPPTYFYEYRMSGVLALKIAEKCSKLSIDEGFYNDSYKHIVKRIQKDGFSKKNWKNEMRPIPNGLRDQIVSVFFFASGVSLINAQRVGAGADLVRYEKSL